MTDETKSLLLSLYKTHGTYIIIIYKKWTKDVLLLLYKTQGVIYLYYFKQM